MKGGRALIPVLSAGHGLNDLLAGYMLGSLAAQQELLEAGIGLVLYNLLAFGGQYPIALWIEKTGRHKRFISSAYVLNLLAVALFAFIPQLSVVLTGIASAVYHVAGGAVCARENKALHIGLFAAPGVAGLIAGGFLAWKGYPLGSVLLPVVGVFVLVLFVLEVPELKTSKGAGVEKPAVLPDKHDIVMILLLTVISLRSAIWNIFQLLYENNYTWLVAIALAAFAGKIIGGWLADRIGWKLYVLISLVSATPLITIFRNELLPFCIGIGLLQSGIPATTAMIIQASHGKTERGIGLSFGAAILFGAFIFSFPAGILMHTVLLSVLLMLCIFFIYLTGRTKTAFK